MEKNKNYIIYLQMQKILLITTVILCANFSTGADKKVSVGPEFVEPLEGEGNFLGKIYDDKNIIDIKNISFTGHTRIGGIKKVDDDSVNVLDLSKIKKLEVEKESYVCPRYQDREYIPQK